MLKKEHRISHGDFLKKRKFYKKFSSLPFSVYFYKDTPNDFIRFSVIVSKKIYKRAVDRNHTRRIIYSVVGEVIKDKNIKNYKYDIIFIVKKEIIGLKYIDIKNEVKKVLSNL